ncbi:MAG: chromosome partitioning protein [Treponema sp.]|jgi:phage shock protein A|nr:chromosome partitioning protein [Treponema sp.]
MNAAEAKDIILGLLTTLKLTEKEIDSLENEAVKWKDRRILASSRGADDLVAEAEKEVERINVRLAGLREEEQSLKEEIETMRRKLPGLATWVRSVDADLLEQELLLTLGQTEEEAETERAFRKLEKESSSDSALEALKAKMKGKNPERKT